MTKAPIGVDDQGHCEKIRQTVPRSSARNLELASAGRDVAFENLRIGLVEIKERRDRASMALPVRRSFCECGGPIISKRRGPMPMRCAECSIAVRQATKAAWNARRKLLQRIARAHFACALVYYQSTGDERRNGLAVEFPGHAIGRTWDRGIADAFNSDGSKTIGAGRGDSATERRYGGNRRSIARRGSFPAILAESRPCKEMPIWVSDAEQLAIEIEWSQPPATDEDQLKRKRVVDAYCREDAVYCARLGER